MEGAVTSDTAQAMPEAAAEAAVATTSADATTPKALRELCIDNSAVTVWRTIIEPNNELKMHRHDRSRIVVGLKGGSLRKVTDSGEESPLVFETGKAYWLEADPPFELHRYAFGQGPGVGPGILALLPLGKQLRIACAGPRLVSIVAHFDDGVLPWRRSDENRGEDPIEVLVIEVKSTEESRPGKRRAPVREDWQPPTTKG